MIDMTTAQVQAEAIAKFATQPENWYRPGNGPIPGDLPAHVLLNGGVRAVFSWTVGPQDVRRHLSVSVTGGMLPNPVVVWTLARFFGFTGAKEDRMGIVMQPARSWVFLADRDENCVVVQEVVPEANLAN